VARGKKIETLHAATTATEREGGASGVRKRRKNNLHRHRGKKRGVGRPADRERPSAAGKGGKRSWRTPPWGSKKEGKGVHYRYLLGEKKKVVDVVLDQSIITSEAIVRGKDRRARHPERILGQVGEESECICQLMSERKGRGSVPPFIRAEEKKKKDHAAGYPSTRGEKKTVFFYPGQNQERKSTIRAEGFRTFKRKTGISLFFEVRGKEYSGPGVRDQSRMNNIVANRGIVRF